MGRPRVPDYTLKHVRYQAGGTSCACLFYAGEAAGVLYNRCGSLIAAEGKSPLVRTASGVTQCRAVAARMGTCR